MVKTDKKNNISSNPKQTARNYSNNTTCDIAMIHPPYIYNKDKYAIFPLPWNLSHVGSPSYVGRYPIGPNWVCEPVGFSTMKSYVEKNSNYSVNIFNLATLKSGVPKEIFKKYKHIHKKDVSILADLSEVLYPNLILSKIKSIKAHLFAVDLHWINYSQGAIQILKLLKQFHPRSYTVVGGFTASYFKDEIMRLFPFIDFLVIGDGCVPILKLIKQIKNNQDYSKVPNLLFREKRKIKRGQRLTLNDFNFIQEDDMSSGLIPTARGCPLQCISCGGSRYASLKINNYKKMKVYSIDSVMKKIFKFMEERNRRHLFLVHDPFLTFGKNNWDNLLGEIRKNKLKIKFIIEFFLPHPKEDILNIADKIPGSIIHISPESINERIRTSYKKLRYSNKELIMNLDIINSIDNVSMNVWFMAGLAGETKLNVSESLSFVRGYYRKIKDKSKNILRYNELLFIDPGSLAFDAPSKYGYKLINRTFKSHMESFETPIFKYQINYRTKTHSRDQLFDLFLYVHNEMNKIYLEHNLIDKNLFDRANLYNNLLRKYESKYDRALFETDKVIRNKSFEKIGNLFRSELGRK